jgi:Ca2+-binding EF-hand superfamily protein
MFNLYILGYDSRRDKQEEILEEMFLNLDGDQDGLVDIDELIKTFFFSIIYSSESDAVLLQFFFTFVI